MTYSEVTDLLTGDIPLPVYLDVNKVLADAADEIDSHLGFIYVTPVDMTDNGPTVRPARLLLKRISVHLSSGRIIMAADAGGQNMQLQAYGRYLIGEAQAALAAIENGTIDLEGAIRLPSAATDPTGPLIHNVDAESNVEAFYDRLANPAYSFPNGSAYRFGSGPSAVTF